MATRRQGGEGDTAGQILDTAESLVQHRGFNGFSYADVARELGITKAALHYHFAGKADLGLALIVRYAQRFTDALAAIDDQITGAPDKLQAYADLYLDVLEGDRMCLCGMLAAEYQSLAEPIRDTLIAFFDENEEWLTRVLDQGRTAGTLHFAGSAGQAAHTIVGALEGAMLLARPYGDAERFRAAATQLLANLKPPTSRSNPRARRASADRSA